MLEKLDSERLIAALQAVDLAQQALTELYKSDDVLLSEHAFALMESVAAVNLKLARLVSITGKKTKKKK